MAAFTFTNFVTLLVLTATLLAVAESNRNLPNYNQKSRQIIVGGDQKWRFGFNYTNWAIKQVFKYDPPSNGTFPHNVYLLRNYQSFLNCDLKKAKKVADVTQGGGKGFKYVMKKQKPFYFACGVGNGLHCKVGLMKFSVIPLARC
uniref:Phytocyanin domain-containing protein n=1 Tax=Daucus carota subsp. sativus TaxID=79200 RepID=A0A175YPZ9_DAUCS